MVISRPSLSLTGNGMTVSTNFRTKEHSVRAGRGAGQDVDAKLPDW